VSCILVVEDEFDLRETLEIFLSEVGFEVEGTHLTQTGLTLMREQSFDCVLLDLMLPDGNGADVLDEMRQDDELRDIPVILMSAIKPLNPTQNQRDTPFLQKPFSFKMLQAALDEVGVEA
jgi:DNA-binding response OmpR family regulator